MCGILGLYSISSGKLDNFLDSRLTLALNVLKRRGPNDRGTEKIALPILKDNPQFLALGHTRLSIIDLTSSGHQPMNSFDGRYVIVFNGEIYNYRELRVELKSAGHVFYTDSDTEVLLISWIHWGEDCLSRLIGMFAFAIYDKRTGLLNCVRDPFGIKPFFYSKDQGFIFASEINALTELMPQRPTLNWQRSYDYLVHGDYDSSAETFFTGIYHLLPAHLIQINTFTGHVGSPKRWWSPKIKENLGVKFNDAVSQVRELFLQNIRLHLRSDVPLGTALSGGIDSSAIVCAIRHIEPDLPINTFSYIASGTELNEEYWVDLVNKHVNAIPHKIHVSDQELVVDLDEMIKSQGEPFGSTSIYAQYRVYQATSENGVTVTLDGQGADELFAGYNGYPGQRLRSMLEMGQLSKATSFLINWSRWPGRSNLMAAKYLASEMTEGNLYKVMRLIDGRAPIPDWINKDPLLDKGVRLEKPRMRPENNNKGRRVIDELSLSIAQRGLVSLLRHGDRNSMRFSVESRVPFLTPELVNLALSLPEDYLISMEGETKHIFRAAMRGIVPDEILNRKDKIGFATPERELLFSMAGEIRAWVKEDLDIPFINRNNLLDEFEQLIIGKKPFASQLWRWTNFIRWIKLFDVKIV
jgi:asparagine synthase (glutamine-hydrolysing)